MFDKVAPFYDDFSDLFLPDLKKYVFDRIELEEDDKVLDIGGGTGQLVDYLSMKEHPIRGYVIDISRKMLTEAKPEIDVILGDSSALPLKSECFDVVLCIDALHHFKRKQKSLNEMMRVLKKEGEVIILELEAKHPISRVIERMERLLGEPSNFLNKDEIAERFLENDFCVEIEKLGFSQYIFHAKR